MNKKFHKLLIGTHNAHYKKSISQFGVLGLSPGQPKVLETLRHIESCTQKELAKACEVEPATITSILPSMEKNDLIKRETLIYETGKRAISVSLTEKGRVVAGEVVRIFDEVEELCFKDIAEEEIETLLSLLERVYTNIK